MGGQRLRKRSRRLRLGTGGLGVARAVGVDHRFAVGTRCAVRTIATIAATAAVAAAAILLTGFAIVAGACGLARRLVDQFGGRGVVGTLDGRGAHRRTRDARRTRLTRRTRLARTVTRLAGRIARLTRLAGTRTRAAAIVAAGDALSHGRGRLARAVFAAGLVAGLQHALAEMGRRMEHLERLLVAEELTKLIGLRDAGELSAGEFDAQRTRLLERGPEVDGPDPAADLISTTA